MGSFKVKNAGTWKNITNPKVKVAGAWTNIKKISVKNAGTWKTIWLREEDVRWSSSAVTTSYGTVTEYDSANTKDGSFGDTSTFGYLFPADNPYTGSSGYVVYSHASGSASTAVVKVNNKFQGSASGYGNESATIDISTNGGTSYSTILRSRTSAQGSDGSIVTSTSASLSVSNRDQLKIRVSGSYSWFYDSYYEWWDYGVAYFEIYDIYVTFS